MTTKRLRTVDRYAQLSAKALELAASEGFGAITQRRLGYEIGISGPAVQHHVKDMELLREGVLADAVRSKNLHAIGNAVRAGYFVPEPLRSAGLRAVCD